MVTAACDTKTDVVVLVRRAVAVPGRRRQVVGVVVPVAAADPAIRRTLDPDSPFGVLRRSSLTHAPLAS